ncbi:hypothetical protein GVAV_002250 [Gurleya vavrai]
MNFNLSELNKKRFLFKNLFENDDPIPFIDERYKNFFVPVFSNLSESDDTTKLKITFDKIKLDLKNSIYFNEDEITNMKDQFLMEEIHPYLEQRKLKTKTTQLNNAESAAESYSNISPPEPNPQNSDMKDKYDGTRDSNILEEKGTKLAKKDSKDEESFTNDFDEIFWG